VSTLHYLLALLGLSGAGRLLGELGVSYNALLERLATRAPGLLEADNWRREERPLEGWEQFVVPRQELDVIGRRLNEVLWDQGLWQQGVRFGYGAHGQETIKVIIHPGATRVLPTSRSWTVSWAAPPDNSSGCSIDPRTIRLARSAPASERPNAWHTTVTTQRRWSERRHLTRLEIIDGPFTRGPRAPSPC